MIMRSLFFGQKKEKIVVLLSCGISEKLIGRVNVGTCSTIILNKRPNLKKMLRFPKHIFA